MKTMTDEDRKELEALLYSSEFGWVDGHEWRIDHKSFELLCKWINNKFQTKVQKKKRNKVLSIKEGEK
jgi:hypothetical protein